MNEDRILEQLDKMVSSGRMTEDEAQRLRESQGTPEFEAVMGEVRARHASVELDAAVEAGQMTRNEADQQLLRLRGGEHPTDSEHASACTRRLVRRSLLTCSIVCATRELVRKTASTDRPPGDLRLLPGLGPW